MSDRELTNKRMQTQDQEYPVECPDVPPPPGLARRTCERLWKTFDDNGDDNGRDVHIDDRDESAPSETFMNSAFFSPESMLPSFLLQSAEQEESATPQTAPSSPVHPASRPARRFDFNDDEPRTHRTSRIGLIASVSVGMLIACFLFPVIRLVERTTRTHITENFVSEINRRVGQYEQIYGSAMVNPEAIEDITPYNLALSGWQEVLLGDIYLAPGWFVDNWPFECVVTSPHCSKTICLREDIPLTDSSPGDILLVVPGRDNLVRSAFGRDFLFKDDRVFFRVLPGR